MVVLATVVCLGFALVYEIGSLRVRTFWQDAYIHSVSIRVSNLMRAGLGDHIHCAVFRTFPQDPPPLAALVDSIGPGNAAVVSLLQKQLPANVRPVMAHRCKHRGRQFVHVTLKDTTHLLSLVITAKREGESFEIEGLLPSVVRSGIPLYHAEAIRYQVSSFETSQYLVYFISDLPRTTNSNILLALAPSLHEFLQAADGA